ncbi:fibronectin type-III domain-containing protein 3A-like isoform X2 [Ornithodoros turicata]|uniref:fibronectin type-III domain-containing protein 3A-like isoform X2 n=1 Tax=Ornithodoros turicata TaxID=34597 RepID=UPI00313888D2
MPSIANTGSVTPSELPMASSAPTEERAANGRTSESSPPASNSTSSPQSPSIVVSSSVLDPTAPQWEATSNVTSNGLLLENGTHYHHHHHHHSHASHRGGAKGGVSHHHKAQAAPQGFLHVGSPVPRGAASIYNPTAGVGTSNPPPHVVLLHINPGETIFFQMGDQMQLIQGPATVRMVSNSSTPPMAVPVQVPPGHVVQQIVDENGTLRHIILSPHTAHVAMAPPHVNSPYTPAATAAPTGAPFFPYAPAAPPPFQGQFHPAMQPTLGAHPSQGMQAQQQQPQSQFGAGHMPPGGQQTVTTTVLQPQQQQATQSAHKDERAQKQFYKLRKKLESRGPLAAPAATTSGSSGSVSPKSSHSSPRPSSRERTNRNNSSESSDTSTLRTLLSSLAAPVVSEVASRTALARWTAPTPAPSNGESSSEAEGTTQSPLLSNLDMIMYELLLLEKGVEKSQKVLKCGKVLESNLEELKPATEYFVCVQACLDEVKGSPSQRCTFQTKTCEPDVPQPPKLVSRTKNSLSLKWNAPCDNGSKITSYVLECDQGNNGKDFEEVFSGPQKQFKVAKLSASTAYCFRLAAANAVGRSEWSAVGKFSTCGTAPSQPDPPRAKEIGVTSIVLEWTARASDDSFTVTMEQENSQHGFLPVYNGAETCCSCLKLTRNTEYRFRLTAHNDDGTSIPSVASSFRTTPDHPGRPGRVSAKGRLHSHSFTASWDAPKDEGGAPVDGYSLELDSGKGFVPVYSGPDREHVCAELEPGTTYRLRVNCHSIGGRSEFSEISSITTLPVCPGRCDPPRLQGKPRAISVHIKWGMPSYNGGSQVTEYEVQVCGLGSDGSTSRLAYRGPDCDCVVAGLLPGRQYQFQVRAFNVAGAGPWSEPLEVMSGAGAPDAPRDVTAVPKSPTTVLVTWEEPACNGAALAEYVLECQKAHPVSTSAAEDEEDTEPNAFVQIYNGRVPQHEAKGLSPASCYCYRVQAVNSAGASLFSEPVSCETPPGPPGPVGSIQWAATHTSLEFSWNPPDCHGSKVLRYQVEVTESNSSLPTLHQTEANHIVVSALEPETLYKVRVQAVNGIGAGPLSTPVVRACTRALPPSPPTVECIGATHSSLKLRWGDPKSTDLIQYTLEMETKPGVFGVVYQGLSHSYKVSRLQEATAYRFRIQATSDAGEGQYSEPISFVTNRALPPAPKAPKATPQGETLCLLEWQPTRSLGEDRISYIVQLQHSNSSEFSVVYRGADTSCTLSSLTPNAFHCARVAAVRHCRDGSGDVTGAFSPPTSFQLAPPPGLTSPAGTASCPAPSVLATQSSPASFIRNWCTKGEEGLSDQQCAVIVVVGFMLLAVLVAVLIKRLESWSRQHLDVQH